MENKEGKLTAPPSRTGRKTDPRTRERYIAAGIDPQDPNCCVQYCRWKKRQMKDDQKRDRPAKVPAKDRRLLRNDVMSEKYLGDEKLQEWAEEILALVDKQKRLRRGRNEKQKESERFMAASIASQKEADKFREKIKAVQSRLAHYRQMARRRRMSLASKLYADKANRIRKELGLPQIRPKKKESK